MIEEKNDVIMDDMGNNNNMRKYLILGGGAFVLFVVGIVASKFLFSEPKKDTKTAVILPQEIQKDDTKLFNDIPVEDTQPQMQTQQPQEKPQQDFKKPEIKPEVEIKTQPQPKKEIKPAVVETKKIQKQTNAGYYIQVAAVTKGEPSKKFLDLITKNGFKYTIMDVDIKGMKVRRVLVGPFTEKEIKKVLPIVKKKISSSAFIKRVK